MHAVSDRYKQAIESGEYTNAYEIRFTPCGKDIAAMKTPVFENYLASRVPDVLNARTAYAETLFECNTDRGGAMYFMGCTGVDAAARSSEYAKDDCTFDNPLTMTIDLTQADGTVIDYTNVGFSTACKNGNYAAEYEIVYYLGEQTTTKTFANESGISKAVVKILPPSDDDFNNYDKIKINITKWCRPKVRSVISCVFIGAAPFVITNDEITTLPSTFKELENDDSNGIGAPSSNQTTFSFYDDKGLNCDAYADGVRIDLFCGIKTDDYQELNPYGVYYVTSSSRNKNIISITAQDDLSDIMGVTKNNFIEKGEDLYCTYWEYISRVLDGIEKGLTTEEYQNALGYNSKGFKALRSASISDLCNEFCVLTGTCINYSDNGSKRLYQRYNDTSEPVAEYYDDDVIDNPTISERIMPDIIKISVHTSLLNRSEGICFNGNVQIPAFDIAGTEITDIDVSYDNSDLVVHFEPYSNSIDDMIYSSNATFRRVLYDSDGNETDNNFYVSDKGSYSYGKNSFVVQRFTYGRNKRTFAVESYICPIRNYIWNGDSKEEPQAAPTVAMSIYRNAAQWIYNWFKKTSVERKFQIITDFCLEVGDVISINGVRGVIYRIETDGTLSTITIRSEV